MYLRTELSVEKDTKNAYDFRHIYGIFNQGAAGESSCPVPSSVRTMSAQAGAKLRRGVEKMLSYTCHSSHCTAVYTSMHELN